MSNKPRYPITGRYKTTDFPELSPIRYDYVKPAEPEPNLGLPSGNGYALLGNIDGTRYWGEINTAGVSGPPGPPGPPGAVIDPETGFLIGPPGAIGFTGSRGLIGPPGPRGTTGTTGTSGQTGPIGPTGYTGSRGAPGTPGTAQVGYTGSSGIIGPPGPAGSPPSYEAGAIGTYTFARVYHPDIYFNYAGVSLQDSTLSSVSTLDQYDRQFGETINGSLLRPISAAYFWGGVSYGSDGTDYLRGIFPSFNSGPQLTGTWRCMGRQDTYNMNYWDYQYDNGTYSANILLGATLWLRIA